MERRLAAILAADVVNYDRLMGEEEARALPALEDLRVVLNHLRPTFDLPVKDAVRPPAAATCVETVAMAAATHSGRVR